MNKVLAVPSLGSKSLLELEAIFQHASIGIAFTLNRVFTRCNRAMENALDYGPGELNGLTTDAIFTSHDEYLHFANEVAATLRMGQTKALVWGFKSKLGRSVICKISATPLESTPYVEGTVWLFDDITQEQHQARELKISHAAFQAVMNNAPVGILFTKDRLITRCNDKFREMFEFGERSPIRLGGRVLYACDEDYAELGKLASPLLSAGLPFTHELHMVRQNGQRFWAHMEAYVLDPHDSTQGTVWILSDRSQEKAQEEAMRRALFENQAILDNAVIGIVFLKSRVVQRCNPFAEQLFGFDEGTMVGTSTRLWYRTEAEYVAVGAELYPQLNADHPYTREGLFKKRNGDLFWGRMSGRLMGGSNAMDDASIWVIEDTTERHETEVALHNATALTRTVVNSANVSIIATDTVGVVTLMNATASRWLGYTPEEVVGLQTPALIHVADEVAERARDLSTELGQRVEPGFEVFVVKARLFGTDEFEWTYVRKDGSSFPVHLSISSLRNEVGDISGFIGIGVDITDRRRADNAIHHANEVLEQRVLQRTAQIKEANQMLRQEIDRRAMVEQEMRYVAHFDALTGLPNRNLLNDRIEQAIEMAKRNVCKVGILFIDLDHFKSVNDTLGHHVGDMLLSQVASRMSFVLRATDTLGRLGGDEFLLLAPDVESAESLAVLGEKLASTLAQPIVVNDHVLHVTLSIGMCCYPDHGDNRDTLMRNADTAMYHAKGSGRNNCKLYTERLKTELDKRFQLENALRYAIQLNELSVHYQPLVDTQNHRVLGLEALLRWNSSALGHISPAQFIPIAEESGSIIPIGAWVLQQSCMQMKKWRDSLGMDLIVAVNLSPLQFRQPNLVGLVARTLRETELPAHALELEITESSLMHNVGEVTSTLKQLSALGVRLAIDDFGTGYSSLSYLRHFPVHKLKIDQSFIQDIGSDERGMGVVITIIALAKTLGLDVIAEGVETQAQLDRLTAEGCSYVQGYLISKPLPEELVALYLAGTPKKA